MKWINLRSNLCPSCGEYLSWDSKDSPLYCKPCNFSITQKKLKNLISKQVGQELEDELPY